MFSEWLLLVCLFILFIYFLFFFVRAKIKDGWFTVKNEKMIDYVHNSVMKNSREQYISYDKCLNFV